MIRAKTGYLWTANNRVLGDEQYRQFGSGTHAIDSRAYQIEQYLAQLEQASTQDMIELQHMIGVPFLKRWQEAFIELIERTDAERFERLLEIAKSWDGKASIDSESYPLLRLFRMLMVRHTFGYLFQECYRKNPTFNPYLLPYEASIFQIIDSRIEYFHSSAYRSFNESQESALVALDDQLSENPEYFAPWGKRNRLRIEHPLAKVIPALGRFLNMDDTAMEGSTYCPKVISGSHVASMRMIAVPGAPENSLFQMPTGQSGHPLSPHYDDLHRLWLEKEYLPMYSEDFRHTLLLKPVH